MPNRNVEFFLVDILVSVDKIARYARSIFSVNEMVANELVLDALLRELEIVGEAMKYVMTSEKIKNMVTPAWRDIVDFRNIVAHAYFGLDFKEIFHIIINDIPTLEKEIMVLLKKYQDKAMLLQALQKTQNDLEQMYRTDSLSYLKKVEDVLK